MQAPKRVRSNSVRSLLSLSLCLFALTILTCFLAAPMQAQQQSYTAMCTCPNNSSLYQVTMTWDRTYMHIGDTANGTYFNNANSACNFPVGNFDVSAVDLADNANQLNYSIWVITDYTGTNTYGPNSTSEEALVHFNAGNSNSTLTWTPPAPGSYIGQPTPPYPATFGGACAGGSGSMTINVIPDETPDLGAPSSSYDCRGTCGSPINITNGNVWRREHDYSLPGLGGGLDVTRTWNSFSQIEAPLRLGMFGDSWLSTYEESLQAGTGNLVKYWRSDGSAWTFIDNNGTYSLDYPVIAQATLTFNSTTNTYTVTLKDGEKRIFNSNGVLTSLADRNGNTTTLAYNGAQHLITVTDPVSRALTVNYNDPNNSGQATSIQDTTGTIATYVYDSGHHLTSATYADGSVINYAYDSNGLMTSVTDGQAKVLETHTYDTSRRGLTSARANGVDSVTVAYNSGSVTLTDSLGNVSTYGVASGQQNMLGKMLVSSVSGSGCDSCGARGNHQYTYSMSENPNSANPDTSVDPLGYTTNSFFDGSDNLTLLTQLVNSTTYQSWSWTYNSFGEVLAATDPLNNVTTNTYDTKGNLLTTTTPSPGGKTKGSTTTFVYDTKGELTSITDPNSNKTTIAYNSVGLMSSITDAQSKVTQYQYDARGNRTLVIDANNQQTSFTYDSMNRLTKITYPTSPASNVQFGYDYRGRRTSVTDQNNKLTQYAYDDADRLISVTDPNNGLTQYGYDTENNLASIKDASNNLTTFTYDALGHVTKTTFPSNLTESYSYDADGNLQSKLDRNNHTISYAYDFLNRLAQKTYPDTTTVAYTYDLANKLTQVVDPTGTYGFTYDNMNRVTQTSVAYSFMSGHTFTVGDGYDAASNRTSMTDPQNASTAYVYDTLNRLSTLTYPSRTNYTFSYDALGRRTQLVRPNGVTTNYQYDTVSDLLSVLHQITGHSGTTTLDGATYQVDAAGNRTQKTDNRTSVASNFSYDPLYELTQVTQSSTTTESYSYDAVGNRLSSLGVSPYAYNTSNELTSTPSATYTYDSDGNMQTKANSTGTTTYTWDFENRLASLALPGSGGTVSFKYDPFGRRIQKSSAAGTTNYVYDGANALEEVDNSANVLARYVQGAGVDEPLAETRSGTTSYYEADGLGSVTSLSNSSGALANSYTYDSFGNLTASSGTIVNPYRYTGREFDSETGIYFNRARYYDPSNGRFLNEDPIRFQGGLNFYRYVSNNPLFSKDPYGLVASCPNCKTLSLDNANEFWDDSFATPEQVDAFFQSTNSPASWDGYDAAAAFIAQGINPGLAVGIIGGETSFGNNGLSPRNMGDPFSSGGSSFAGSLSRAVGAVVKLENHTYTDDTPVTALFNGMNDLPSDIKGSGQVYSTTDADKYPTFVDSWFRKLARFLGKCQ